MNAVFFFLLFPRSECSVYFFPPTCSLISRLSESYCFVMELIHSVFQYFYSIIEFSTQLLGLVLNN
jgi:hypothetical protein